MRFIGGCRRDRDLGPIKPPGVNVKGRGNRRVLYPSWDLPSHDRVSYCGLSTAAVESAGNRSGLVGVSRPDARAPDRDRCTDRPGGAAAR